MNKTQKIVIAAIALVIIGFALAVQVVKQDNKAQVQELVQQGNVLLRDSAFKIGSQNAKVVIVEFFDPECESCRMFHPYTKMLLEQFTGNVQFVLRYAPFHPNSKFAIKILEAARKQNRYLETLEVLYQHQPEWGDHHNPNPELIWKYLENVELDIAQVRKDLEDPATQELIAQDERDGSALGVRMTPTFFVNGEELQEFSYDALVALVQKQLAK